MFSGCLSVILPAFLVCFYHFSQAHKNIFVLLNLCPPLPGLISCVEETGLQKSCIAQACTLSDFLLAWWLLNKWISVCFLMLFLGISCNFYGGKGRCLQFSSRSCPPFCQCSCWWTHLLCGLSDMTDICWVFLTWHCSSDLEHSFISSFKDLTGRALTMAATNKKMRGGSCHVNQLCWWMNSNLWSQSGKRAPWDWAIFWFVSERAFFILLIIIVALQWEDSVYDFTLQKIL